MLRKGLRIIFQIGILYLFYRIGVWIQGKFELVIPASVIGLLLLFLCLWLKILPEAWIASGASFMTRHLILFFIPATVGMINYYPLLLGKGFFLVVITVLSSLLVLLSAAYTSEWLARRERDPYG